MSAADQASRPSPRALVVDLATRFGGSDARVLGLAGACPPGTVALAVLRDAPVHVEALARGIPAYVVGARKSDPRIVGRLARLIRRGRFDVVDTQNPQSRVWGSIAAWLAGVGLVSTLNSWYEAEHEGRLKGRVYQGIERLPPRPDLYVVVAADIRAHLLAQGVPDERIALIPNAIGSTVPLAPDDAVAVRGELGVPPDAPLVVAVGRLVEAKGYDTLIDAASILGPRLPALHVVIAGEGHLRPALEDQIARLGLSGRVHLPGFRDPSAVARLVAAADVFAMPSRTEGTPLALLEAAAAGRPIVASRVGGIPTVVSDEVEAVLTPPGDAAAIAEALGNLLPDEPRRRALGAAAARRVADEFGRARQVEQTMHAYEAVAQRKRPDRKRPAISA